MIARRLLATSLLAVVSAVTWLAQAAAQTPVPLTPPAPQEATGKAAHKATPKPVATKRATPPQPAPNQAAAPTEGDADLAFGAFQRGSYLTAFSIATRRVEEKNDVKAMTLLGELYAHGFGVPRNDQKAAEWYRLAADRGDREAMFALGMFYMGGRLGTPNAEQGTKLLATAAKLGQAAASYDLALLYLEGKVFPQDFTRAAELLRSAADAGTPEAQYALATLYKEGRGVLCSTARVSRGMSRWRPRSCRRLRAKAILSLRTASPIFWRSGAG